MVEDLPPAKGARCFPQGSLLVRRPDRARAFQGSRSTTGCVAMTPAGYWFIACGGGCLSLRTSPRGRRRRNGPRELGGAARGWRLDHDRPPPGDHPHDRAAAGRTGNAPGRAITAGSLGSFRALGKIAKLEMFETETFPAEDVKLFAGTPVLQSFNRWSVYLAAPEVARRLPKSVTTLGAGPVAVKPRPTLTVEVSAGQPNYLAAAALAAETVFLFEAAWEHLRDSPDLHVQRPGYRTFHAVTPASLRDRATSRQAPAASGLADSRCEPSSQSGSYERSWLASHCFSYRWIGGSPEWFTRRTAAAARLVSVPGQRQRSAVPRPGCSLVREGGRIAGRVKSGSTVRPGR
jgi:hypothetical protein